jgi:uncharacterized OsmC-like protein
VEHIEEAVRQARAYLREHPAEARYPDSEARAIVADGLRIAVSGPDLAAMETDMPTSVGGSAMAPPPGWYLRAAEASCVATLMVMRAAEVGRSLSGLEVRVLSESDDRGILGMDDSIPSGPFWTRITVTAHGTGQDELQEMVDWAIAHCPVTDAVSRAVPMEVEVQAR